MIRMSKWWNYFRDYFPCKLVKEVELDPSRNYIVGYHPHVNLLLRIGVL